MNRFERRRQEALDRSARRKNPLSPTQSAGILNLAGVSTSQTRPARVATPLKPLSPSLAPTPSPPAPPPAAPLFAAKEIVEVKALRHLVDAWNLAAIDAPYLFTTCDLQFEKQINLMTYWRSLRLCKWLVQLNCDIIDAMDSDRGFSWFTGKVRETKGGRWNVYVNTMSPLLVEMSRAAKSFLNGEYRQLQTKQTPQQRDMTAILLRDVRHVLESNMKTDALAGPALITFAEVRLACVLKVVVQVADGYSNVDDARGRLRSILTERFADAKGRLAKSLAGLVSEFQVKLTKKRQRRAEGPNPETIREAGCAVMAALTGVTKLQASIDRDGGQVRDSLVGCSSAGDWARYAKVIMAGEVAMSVLKCGPKLDDPFEVMFNYDIGELDHAIGEVCNYSPELNTDCGVVRDDLRRQVTETFRRPMVCMAVRAIARELISLRTVPGEFVQSVVTAYVAEEDRARESQVARLESSDCS